MSDPAVFQRALERERNARKQAESVLEDKSRQLYNANEELKETAAALAKEATMIQMILQTAAEGIITFNSTGKIESSNPAANRIFGYEDSSLIGKSILDILPENYWSNKIDASRKTDGLDEYFWTSTESSVAKRATGRRIDDTCFDMELAGSRVEIENRNLFTWIIRDITQRISLERQLSHAQKMESVGQLAAGVAHEINTPIQFIGSNLRFLEDAFSQWDNVFSCYEKLLTACQQGMDTTELCSSIESEVENSGLDFIRNEFPMAISQSSDGADQVADIIRAMKVFSHPGFEDKVNSDLSTLIESVITVSRNEWKYVARMDVKLDSNLPPVPCYPAEFNQAILNLVVNAAHAIEEKYGTEVSDHGELQGLIVVEACGFDQYVEIRICDNGIGIPEKVKKRIFEPFFTTKPVGVGTGQGLSIVYSIMVENHGGKLDVESTEGEGSTFVIKLPLGDQPLNTKQQAVNSKL